MANVHNLLPFILSGLVSGSIYGIAAMGLVLTYKTSGIFNFAHGAVAAIAAGLFYLLDAQEHLNWGLSAVISIVVIAFGFGLVMERIAYVLVGVSTAMKVVATVALMVSITAAFQLWYGFGTYIFPSYLSTNTFRLGRVNIGYNQVVVMAVGLVAVGCLTAILRYSTLGRHTRAIIDDPVLFQLSGRSATAVRRRGWVIGCGFAAISGLLIAPSLGLDGTSLTLLVVQSFGAAAIGRFTSLPVAYGGALGLGVIGAVSTKYAVQHPALNGLPSGLPFIVLLLVLVFTPRKRLVDLGAALEKRIAVPATGALRTRLAKLAAPVAVLGFVPFFVGAKLTIWTDGLVFMIIFLSLGLVVRTANQVSLCQMSFAAIGAVTFHKLLAAGIPWPVGVVLAGAVVIPVGALIAIPAIRLSGVYLALATLGFGILLEQQVYTTNWMFGQGGTSLPVRRPDFATTQRAYYYVVLVAVLLALGAIRWVEGGQLGRLLRAKADSSTALSSLGTSVRTPSVLAFCISAFLAGIAGALSGPIFGIVGPGSFQTVPTSLMLVALIVLAGRDPRIRSFGVALGGAIGLVILPGYIGNAKLQNWLNLLFAVAAVHTAVSSGGRHLRLRRNRQDGSDQATAGDIANRAASPGQLATATVPSSAVPSQRAHSTIGTGR